MKRIKDCFVILLIILFLPSCYNMVKKNSGFEFPPSPPEINSLIANIEKRNKTDRSFKGLGKVNIWGSQFSQTSRAAWLGVSDGRLRIEFLAMPGQPTAKMIYDGEELYFSSQLDEQAYQNFSSDPCLKRVTGISVRVSEVTSFLSGGIPVYEHDTIELNPSESDNGFVLVLKKRWLGPVEKIYLNDSFSMIEKVEIYRWGQKVYQAELADVKSVNGHQIPYILTISNAKGKGFRFSIDKYWTDFTVRPEMFAIGSVKQ